MFHFADTPLRQVLADIGYCYNVKLTANDMDKQLTGDIKATSLDDIVDLIEQTLDVKIEKK